MTIGRAAQSPILPCTRRGLSCRRCRHRRGGLLPHLFTLTPRLPAWRFVFCDTFRHRALKRGACAWREPCAASCPVVSGLSSPNFKTGAAFNRALGSKNSERLPGPKAKPARVRRGSGERKPPGAKIFRRPTRSRRRHGGGRISGGKRSQHPVATQPHRRAKNRNPGAGNGERAHLAEAGTGGGRKVATRGHGTSASPFRKRPRPR